MPKPKAKSKSTKGLVKVGKLKFDKTLVAVIAVVVVAAGGYLFYQASHAATVINSDGLTSGQCLLAGQNSTNSVVTMAMQGDGNFVLYKGNTVLWSTGTAGTGSKNRLCMQTDGNLVLYTSTNKVLWQSHTAGFSHYRIYLNQYPNAMAMGLSVGYTPDKSRLYNTPTPWISGKRSTLDLVFAVLTMGSQLTSPDGSHRLVMQTDGNLVIYNSKNIATWTSGTSGTTAHYLGWLTSFSLVDTAGNRIKVLANLSGPRDLIMQNDGNLVVYNEAGKAIWNSGTAGK